MRTLLTAGLALMTVVLTGCTESNPPTTPTPEPTATGTVSPTVTATQVPPTTTPLPTAAPVPPTRVPPAPAPPTPAPPPEPTLAPAPPPSLAPPLPAPAPVSGDFSEVVRGDPSRPWVALVINVGAGFTPAIGMLDTLAAKSYRPTFFVMGWWAERSPEVLRMIATGGHEIASHGHSVANLTQVSDAEISTDLERADQAISAVTGRSTRPLWSASASARDARVLRVAAEVGFRSIFWSADSGDWTYQATAESVYQRTMNGVSNGAIIVMHFDSPTTVDSTAVALPRLIDDIRAAGFRLVSISEMLGG